MRTADGALPPVLNADRYRQGCVHQGQAGEGKTMKLYNFWRSGPSYRVRIALNLKGVPFEYLPVSLVRDEHLEPAFQAINPQQLVPALVVQGRVLTQSPAILEWLEECYPKPPLLPADPAGRAQVRAMAAMIGCDVHPLQNRRVLQYLRQTLAADEPAVQAWCATWIGAGLDAFHTLVSAQARGGFSYGEQPTLADVYLMPQLEAARRFGVDLGRWPRLREIEERCLALEAFERAMPARQPDAASA